MGKNLLGRSSRKKNKGVSEGSTGSGGNSNASSLRRTRSEESSVSESLAGALHNREELEDVFKRFDANGDGKISSSELGEILRSMGGRVGSQELGLMMKEADADGDGFISLEEFIDLNTKGNDRATCLEDLKNAFQVFDLDRNGSISADELYQVLKGMGDGSTREDCKNMITGVDRNGDGLINFEEFKTMMTSSSSASSSK